MQLLRILVSRVRRLAASASHKSGKSHDMMVAGARAQVNSMVDFTFKPPQEREAERERFKKLLFDAKTKNVPVKA